jgi:hypothetical protein
VARGIKDALDELSPPNEDPRVHVDVLRGDDNRFAVPRGAALAVCREQVFRNLDVLMRDTQALGKLTTSFTTEDLERLAG